MRKRDLAEKIDRLRRKGKALFLAGLVLLGSSAYAKNANAENTDTIPTDYFSKFVFERLPIPTMFDASYEDLKRIIIPNELGNVMLQDKVLHRDMYITTTINELLIIKDTKNVSKSNQKLLGRV